ncbi:MAG TPA: N-acetylmuramoyl-L-alanine amidase [Chitinophagaceae bacterium]|jgi:N-acetylmuramoyl-L-alanine amidase|nr:N-acetylmuramoyl-L-alanine amidase [Chitinophagaceae bacterium]
MILRATTSKTLILCSFFVLLAGKGFSRNELADTTIKDILLAGNPPVSSLLPEVNVPVGRYALANRLYVSMVDSLVRVIGRYPLIDSAGLNYSPEWVGTPNMGLRRPNYVIIHHTATRNCNEVLSEFTTTGGREASAHYVIDKDGVVHHMLNDLLRSHHAGDSKWGNTTDLNSSSIGIELVNNGYESFSTEQMNSLLILLERLKNAYKIPDANFIGHGDIAPTRKADPNYRFPWKDLSQKGFGLWWDDTTNVQVPDNFDYLMALRIIGYDIASSVSVVAAFKRHFLGDNSGGSMNADLRRVIYVLYRKYQ